MTTPQRAEALDTLAKELDLVIQVQDITQVKSLTTFVQREKTLHQMHYLVIDLTDTDFSKEHILSAVQLLRRFAPAELIFLAPDSAETRMLFQFFASFRTTGVVLDDQWLDRLRACFLEEDSFEQRMDTVRRGLTAQAEQLVRLSIPPEFTLHIGVAGTQSRIGVTTQCFSLTYYLQELGFRPALTDPTGRLLARLSQFYEEELEEDGPGISLRGLSVQPDCAPPFNLWVTDLGVLDRGTLPAFLQADLRILVGGTKPWELPQLASALRLLPPDKQPSLTLLSFTSQEGEESVQGYLQSVTARTAYQPDLWQMGSREVYAKTLLPILRTRLGGEL